MASKQRDPSPVDPEKVGLDVSQSLSAQRGTILEHSHDADEAMKAFEGRQGHIEIDEATNKRLLRLIDWHLMPILCCVYGLNFLDKTTLSYASIMGIKDDIHLKAAVSGFGGAVAIRFFLGVFEAAVTPGFALFTSQWYTKHEQGTRIGIWFSFNGVAQIFGGLVAYGIAVGTEKNPASIAGWKILFLVTGLLTAAMGIVFFFFMPDNQLNARWLTKEDRVLAVERVRVNQQGIGNKHYKLYQLKEALLDPLTWAFVFYALVAGKFQEQVTGIKSFGYSENESLLYGTPGGAVEIVTLIISGYLGDRFGQRLLISMLGLSLALLGIILIVALPQSNPHGRIAGYYLTQAGATPFVALLSLVATNIAGYTKKTTVAALYLIAYCVGNIIGPQTFRPQDAPTYRSAEITIIVCYALGLLDVFFIWWYCKQQNTKKAKARAEPGYVKLENQEWLDLTDKENPEFDYAL
ncbi:putative mfs allantoate [Phaeomoniella chlamydospora]|uniref:Putative mfs allantoate n=1 Tax=Phaeomoniella chlamydospora TaxID=158046 RepID=A0A0G2F4R1_PHACM|nr:putative mfs allantoate [Phaeomoniella chlamydospora]